MSKRKFGFALYLIISVLYLICLTHPCPAQAAENSKDTRPPSDCYASSGGACADGLAGGIEADDVWAIDPGRACTLTVHAYAGQAITGRDPVSGDPSAAQDAPPQAGAVYTLWKVGSVSQIIADDTVSLYVHDVDRDFLNLISDICGTSTEGIEVSSEFYYPISEMQDALDALNKHSGAELTGEDALTDLTAKNGTPLQPTDEYGVTYADNLSQGLYVLARTSVPSSDTSCVISGSYPSFIMLPAMNTVSDDSSDGNAQGPAWLYEVSVYPKNQTAASGKKISLEDQPGSCADADDRETGTEAEFITYVHIPDIGEDAEYDVIRMRDEMTDGLMFKEITGVYSGPLLQEDALSSDTLLSCRRLQPETEYTVEAGEHAFALELTRAGMDVIHSLRAECGIYVLYKAILTPDACIGMSGENVNKSAWSLSTSHTADVFTLPAAKVYVPTYGIDLMKTGLDDAEKAGFEIRRGNSLLYFVPKTAGIYVLAGTNGGEGQTSLLAPAEGGLLRILGLDAAAYTFTETRTQQGHSLLASPFTITLTADPVKNGALRQAELTMDGIRPVCLTLRQDNAGIAELTVTNAGAITPLKAGDDGYWKAAAFVVVSGLLLLSALLIVWHRQGKG